MIPYGWAVKVTDECCIVSPADKHRMLCGRWVGYAPTVPPAFPHAVHDVCRRLWAEGGYQVPPVFDEYGVCPECSGDVALVGGKVKAHRMWVVGRHGTYQSAEPCPGAGREPEVGS